MANYFQGGVAINPPQNQITELAEPRVLADLQMNAANNATARRGQTLAALQANKENAIAQQNADNNTKLVAASVDSTNQELEMKRMQQKMFMDMNNAYASGDMKTYQRLLEVSNPEGAQRIKESQANIASLVSKNKLTESQANYYDMQTRGQQIQNTASGLQLAGMLAHKMVLSGDPGQDMAKYGPALEALGVPVEIYSNPDLLMGLSTFSQSGMGKNGKYDPYTTEAMKQGVKTVTTASETLQKASETRSKIQGLITLADDTRTGYDPGGYRQKMGTLFGTDEAGVTGLVTQISNELALGARQTLMKGAGTMSDADREFLVQIVGNPQNHTRESYGAALKYMDAMYGAMEQRQQFLIKYTEQNKGLNQSEMQDAWFKSEEYKQTEMMLKEQQSVFRKLAGIKEDQSPTTNKGAGYGEQAYNPSGGYFDDLMQK